MSGSRRSRTALLRNGWILAWALGIVGVLGLTRSSSFGGFILASGLIVTAIGIAVVRDGRLLEALRQGYRGRSQLPSRGGDLFARCEGWIVLAVGLGLAVLGVATTFFGYR